MLNGNYVTSVGLSAFAPPTSSPMPAEELQALLRTRGLHLKLGNMLKGGIVSQVYSAVDARGNSVVVKHTQDVVSGFPAMPNLSHKSHYVDTALLRYLETNSAVRVPHVMNAFEDSPITVMEDLRQSGFRLVSDITAAGTAPVHAALSTGRSLALIQLALGEHAEFITAESSRELFYDRGFELWHSYPNSPVKHREIEERFVNERRQLIAVDTHPKNMFVDDDGNVAWIDFGRSTWADRDFALPNCIAHFVLYALAGVIAVNDAHTFVETVLTAYRELLPVDEEVFCQYLALEVLHRWSGKWIAGIDTREQKSAIANYALSIFDDEVLCIDTALSRIADFAVKPKS